MRSDAQRSLRLVPDDTKRFVLLIAGAWIAGLAIFILLGIAWPATSATHGADRASPSSDVSTTTVAYGRAAPSLGANAASHASAVAPPVELAGHRWAPAVAPPVELAGHRWAPAVAPPVELAGHRWVPAVAPPDAVRTPSRA
jgi:hypothetical protein